MVISCRSAGSRPLQAARSRRPALAAACRPSRGPTALEVRGDQDLIPPGRESHVQIWSDGWHEAQFDPEFAEVYARVFRSCRDCLADVIAAGRAAGAFRGDRDPVAGAQTIVTMAMAVSGLRAVRAPLLDQAQARTMLAELLGQELGYRPQWA
ncbi:TetR family transcriptional regulator C-terminal domain-containing protein [Saccharopolyspora sp. NPDC050389]|uniref:TetR family transcriptional regulator C-terminal domain-containing protein n=1 Tax=Saccharopolyspora sp. NPDC050389 TaxID=3155516 RepID=UPI0033F0920F